MGKNDGSRRWGRLLVALLLLATLTAGWPLSADSARAAQTDSDAGAIVEGSPEAAPPALDELATEAPVDDISPPEAPAAPVSLVIPTMLTVSSRVSDDTNPCRTIDSRWSAVEIWPTVDRVWLDPFTGLGGEIHFEEGAFPALFGWDSYGGAAVGGVVVPDTADATETLANFYDYRLYLGAVSSDAGLTAPSGILSIAYLCVPAPPAAEEPPTEIPAETPSAPSPAAATEIPAGAGTNGSPPPPVASEVVVQSAAIGIGSVVTVAEPLNLRVSPSLSATVRAVLDTGTVVTVVGGPQSGSGYVWWQLSTPSGTGWSVVDYLIEQPVTVTPAASVTPTRTATRTPTVSTGSGIAIDGTVRVLQRLNLRAQPGTAAEIVAVMPVGTQGRVLAGPQSANGYQWWQISTSLGTGWAAGVYLSVVPGTVTPFASNTPVLSATPTSTRTWTPTAVQSQTATPTGTTIPSGGIAIGDLVQVTTRVNLRTTPGTGAAVITVLPVGSQWPVVDGPQLATGFTWWKLDTSSGAGWVAAPYLTRVGVAPTATATRTATVSPTATRTRTPTLSPTITLTPTVTLTPTITLTPAKCTSFAYGDIVRTIDTVNFRAQPSTSGAIIRTLAVGERGSVKGGPTSASGYTWCQIQIGSTSGWVASQYLARVSGPPPAPNGSATPRPSPPPPSGGSASVVYEGSSGSGMIALTFDAGAERGYAAYILDVLAEYGVHATFGMTGTWARDNPDLVQRMVDEGHQLINHTWSHPSFTGGSSSTTVLTRSGRIDQLDRAEAIVEQQTGYRMKPYWRPPYGDISSSVLSDVYAGGYYITVMWSCDTLGWNGASEQQIMNRCMYPSGAGDIILMHVGADGLDWAVTGDMIRYFLNKGLQIVTIEELLGS